MNASRDIYSPIDAAMERCEPFDYAMRWYLKAWGLRSQYPRVVEVWGLFNHTTVNPPGNPIVSPEQACLYDEIKRECEQAGLGS